LERPFAGPDHIGGEVLVPPGREPFGDDGVDLRPLTGEDEELLGVAFDRFVEDPFDVDRRVDVRLVRGEGAVLAVALAGPRQRKGEVAGESDPLHPGKATGRAGSARRALVPTGGWTPRRSGAPCCLGFFGDRRGGRFDALRRLDRGRAT